MKYKLNEKGYTTLSSCYKDNKHKITVGIATIRNRLKKGWSLEKALFTPKEKTIDTKLGAHMIEGVKYPNLPSISRAYGVSENTIYKRYSRGCRGDNLIPPKKLNSYKKPEVPQIFKFYVGSKGFKSQTAACKHYGVKVVTFRNRIRNGWTVDQAMELEPKVDSRTTKSTKYKVDSKNLSISQLSKKHLTPVSTIRDRLSRGASIEQAIGLEPIAKNSLKTQREVKKKQNTSTPINLTVFGKSYTSYKSLADEYGINATTLNQRIVKYGHSPEYAVTMKGKNNTVNVGGKTYKSKAAFARACGLSSAVLLSRIMNGWSLEQIAGIEERVTRSSIFYNDKHYNSLKLLADEIGIPETVLRSRLHYGKTIEEAVDAGQRIKNSGRYNTTILSRDVGLANALGCLYFVTININGNYRHKIGITKDSVNKRLKGEGYEFKVIKKVKGTLLECYELEQELLALLYDKRDETITSDMLDGYSEIFNLNDDDINIVIDLLS